MNVSTALATVTEESLDVFVEAYRAQTGRPTLFNEMIAAEIIDRLEAGELLSVICRDDHLPSYPTVNAWRRASPSFSSMIAQARTGQATPLVEEAVQILDEASTDSMAHVQKADKRASIRLQLAKCFDREQYGDKVQQDINLKGVVITTQDTRLRQLLED